MCTNLPGRNFLHNKTTILLTGPPGVGKTTAIQKLIKVMQRHQIEPSGFYTEEVRSENGYRIGFDVVTLDGKRIPLAREHTNSRMHHPKVGKYFVFTKDFEDIALPSITITDKKFIIIDEIGKMELLSEKFRNQIIQLNGKTGIIATIPKNKQPFELIDNLRSANNSIVFEVTKANRNAIVDEIFKTINRTPTL